MYKIVIKENDKYAILTLTDNMLYADKVYFDSRKNSGHAEEVCEGLNFKLALEEYEKSPWYVKAFSSKPRRK